MNCNGIATILDEHRGARLKAAERGTVDAHLLECADCAAAWHAQTELAALVVPVPDGLLERVLLAARAPRAVQPRRARTPFVVASALLAGAALAAATVVSLSGHSDSGGSPPAATAAPMLKMFAPAAAPAPTADGPPQDAVQPRTSVELVEVALSFVPIVRLPLDYPPAALEQRLEGHVVVEFDVTAAGAVENARAVRSSDTVFEEAALSAVSRWRYLPRVAAGKRIAEKGVRTQLTFALGAETPPPDPRQQRAQQEWLRAYREFSAGLAVALDRLAADDLRGAELQLDEMQALYGYGSDPFRGDLSSFYGYLFTVQGNYDRAIDAYETALAAYAQSGAARSGPWVPLANLYYARHQYDLALKTLLLLRQATNGSALLGADAEALMARLAALGVTEETVAR